MARFVITHAESPHRISSIQLLPTRKNKLIGSSELFTDSENPFFFTKKKECSIVVL
ncbi:unnamed protein product [Brassica rapa subsp. trilocularis]|uniref:(rape) hypothetical protein n=1 Tax=Brassica napus TaxID=3708 RepID=A0A816VFP0_BRANA|nr:unnamed protein product [Brassica napus]